MLLNLLKNNVSKSLLYILFFAGILKLSGMLLTWFWNNHLVMSFDLQEITFLESVGMIAFFYLVYSGVKFGFNTLTNQISGNDKMTPGKMPECQNCEKNSTNNDLKRIKNLTNEEKEKLKEAIAKCCGFAQNTQDLRQQVHIPIQQNSKIVTKLRN